MKLYKRVGSPCWSVDFTCPRTGKRRRVSTGENLKREATDKATRIVAEASKVPDGYQTIGNALQAYRDHLEASGARSIRLVDLMIHKTLGTGPRHDKRFHLPRDMGVAEITPANLAALVEQRRREGNGPQIIVHEIKVIRAACLRACRLEGVRLSPMMSDTDAWQMPKLTTKTRYLSRDEWQALHDAMAPGVHRDLMVVLSATGGRWSEVATLRWDQVDLSGWSYIRVWGSKTERERLVPIPAVALDVLKRRYVERSGTRVFPEVSVLENGLAVSDRAINAAINRAGLNADPETVRKHGKATVHSLRHTFASWLLQGGANLAEVQDALGHANINMTRRYAHLSPAKTISKLARTIDGHLEPQVA